MKTVYLLRHAKAEELNRHGDKARNLSERGIHEAKSLVSTLERLPIPADIVLCSTADRTRQTLDMIEQCRLLEDSELLYDDALYLAAAEQLLEFLQSLPSEHNAVLFVGHNPGIEQLALSLVGTGDAIDISNMTLKFPTCGFAGLSFECSSWEDIVVSSGHLDTFWVPGHGTGKLMPEQGHLGS